MAYIGAEPLPGQNREVDDISSSFNGSTTAFTLQVNGLNVSPETANNILVNIGGVIQNPGTDYTIAASTITFTTAPASGLSFFALILGAGINTATVADQTIGTSKILDNAVTADKLAHTSVTAGSYTTADITIDAQGRITAAANGSISGAEIANNAVTTAKIADSTGSSDGVTTAKIATSAITTAKIADQAVDLSKLPHGTSSNDGKFLRANNGADPTFETVTSTTINNNADNRIITGSGTANTLNAETRVVIDSNNNMGIGTTSPNVQGANSDSTILSVIETHGSRRGQIELGDNQNVDQGGIGDIHFVGHYQNANHKIMASIKGLSNGSTSGQRGADLLFETKTDGSATVGERVRITSAGNVGIGVASPAAKLQVAGSAHITGQDSVALTALQLSFASSEGHIKVKNTNGSPASNIAFHTTDTSGTTNRVMNITHEGKVGIGDTSPSQALVVKTSNNVDYDISTGTTNPALVIKSAGTTGTNKCIGLSFNGPNSNGEGYITMVGTSSSEMEMRFSMRTGGTRADRVFFQPNGRIRVPQVFSTAGSSMRDVQCESDGTFACLTSITEAKMNIADLTDISWLYNLKPKTFNFRKKTSDIVTGENTYLDEAEDEKAYGFLAEEVETINKDFCFYDKDSEGNDKLAGVYYKTMVVPLIKAVQELKAENTALTTRVAALEAA